MRIIRSLISLFLFSVLLLSTSCDKDEQEDSYLVTIDIDAPNTVNKGAPFSVEVAYTRDNDIIHNVKVEILNENGHSMTKLIEQHVHEANAYTFKKDDIIIEEVGTYTLRAFSSDLHGDMEDGEHGEEHAGESEHNADGEHDEKGEEDAHNTVEKIITVQ